MSDENLEDLYENAPCGYVSALPDGTVVKLNATFARWLGRDREDILGTRFVDLLTAGGRIYHETHYAPLLRMQGTVRALAVDFVGDAGRRLPALINSVMETDDSGEPLVIRTAVFDASDRKEYERELIRTRERERAARERTERLQRLTAALSAALDPDAIAAALAEEMIAGDATGAAVALVQPDGRLRVAAAHGGVAAGTDLSVPAEGRLADVVGGRAVFLPDAGGEDVAALVGRGGGATALLPLRADGRTLAVVAVALGGATAWGDEETSFVTACAAQSAQALERARLHAATAELAGRTTFLAEASHRVTAAGTSSERIDEVARLLVPTVGEAARVEIGLPGDIAATAVAGDEALLGPGPATAVAAKAVTAAGLHEEVDAAGRVAYAGIALRASDEVIGTLVVARTLAAGGFEPSLRQLLAAFAERTALALENAILYERERSVAHKLQQSMLAGDPPSDDRFSVATTYAPGVETLEVGGDWHDAFMLDRGRIALVVGDVVGRGIEAATAMGQLRSAVRALALATSGPAHLLERLDRFAEHIETARMATVVYCELELDTGHLRYACAGHPPPMLLAPAAPPELLWDGRSTPLSAGPLSVAPREGVAVLPAGSRLLLYSDGLFERRNEPLDTGLDRLATEFAQRREQPIEAVTDALAGVMAPTDGSRDDVCVLCCAYARPATGDLAGGVPASASA